MASDLLDRLIAIYSRLDVAKVPADAAFKTLEGEYDGDDKIFNGALARVKQIKKLLEKRVQIQESKQKQVAWALRTISQLIGLEDGELDICDRLIRHRYYGRWDPAQQTYYEEMSSALDTMLDYFLSFTQRNPNEKPGHPGEKAGNPVNSAHRFLIRYQGLPDPTESPRNELAHLVNLLLKTSPSQFRGFYYEDHVGKSDEVIPKLKKACARAAVFVQIVQNEMFSKRYAGKDNFCAIEFEEAATLNKPTIFVFADGTHPKDLIEEYDVLLPLVDWHERIRNGGVINLARTETAADVDQIAKNHAVLNTLVIDQVKTLRDRIYDNVPADAIAPPPAAPLPAAT